MNNRKNIEKLGEILEQLDMLEPNFFTRQKHIKNLLCRYLNMKTVVAFVGSGTSIPLGYPNWTTFASEILVILLLIFDDELKINREIKGLPTEILKSHLDELKTICNSGDSEGNPHKKNYERLQSIFYLTSKKAIEKETETLIEEISEKSKEKVLSKEPKLLPKDELDQYYRQAEKAFISKKIDEYRNILTDKWLKDIQEVFANFDKNIDLGSRFYKYLKYINNTQESEMNALVIFTECERLLSSDKEWEVTKQSKVFRLIFKMYFDYKHSNVKKHLESSNKNEEFQKLNKSQNPYLFLLDLPIKKFVTPNYDVEIERAILYKNLTSSTNNKLIRQKIYGEPSEKIIEAVGSNSFSQIGNKCEELAKFSIARYEENEYSVFHCHGRIDNVESCIVSEEDYQRWYLKESDAGKYLPFRQTLDFALDSNPILFIGFGLKDADLMRTLRSITAKRPLDRNRNPLFCLLYIPKGDIKPRIEDQVIDHGQNKTKYKWESFEAFDDECKALYLKYGLHIIPIFTQPVNDLVETELTFDLPPQGLESTCFELQKLQLEWQEWWTNIQQKPQFRKFQINTNELSNSYMHYEFNLKIPPNNKPLVENFHRKLTPKLNTALNLNDLNDSTDNDDEILFSGQNEFAPHLAVIVGDGGTGKSWSVQQFLSDLRKEKEKYKSTLKYKDWKIFYWSSYYANDVLTGIDRLIDFFLPNTDKTENKLEILKQIVDNNDKAIIVFDGLEKLLNPNSENTEGLSVSPEVKQFFKIISHENVKSRIIITTRLFPADVLDNINSKTEQTANEDLKRKLLDKKTKVKKEQIISAPKCWVETLQNDQDFWFFENSKHGLNNHKYLSSFCSLVDGHIFGISLLSGVIKDLLQMTAENIEKTGEEQNIEKIKKCDELIRRIANAPVENRIQRVIEEAINNLDRGTYNCEHGVIKKIAALNPQEYSNEKYNIIHHFIQRIALFMHPVREQIVERCFRQAFESSFGKYIYEKLKDNDLIKVLFNDVLKTVLQKNLLQEVHLHEVILKKRVEAYVVHPVVRSYVFERIHESKFSSLPSLQLPGSTSRKEVVDPGNYQGKEVAENLFNDLNECAREEIDKIGQNNTPSGNFEDAEFQQKLAADFCRSAFSVLRSRFCSNTVARWGNYRDYLKLVLRLYDTAKYVSPDLWRHEEPTKDGLNYCLPRNGLTAPLYPDELAWVYNEVGLVSLSMGNMLNAIPFWQQGLEISRLIDRADTGRYIFQSYFSLGAVNIHYGKLNTAKDYLEKAFELANLLKNPSLSNRVLGYLALVKYLRGNLEESDRDFTTACQALAENPRARSIFYQQHGELYLKMDNLDAAFHKIKQSENLAGAEYYPDLLAYARLSKANYYLQNNEFSEAQSEYQYVLGKAREFKIRRLEAGTLSGMARLAEKLGDYATAKEKAIQSIKIANEYLLHLHQTTGMLILGKILVKGHQHRDLGISYLKAAQNMAKKQEYFLRMNEATTELQNHNAI